MSASSELILEPRRPLDIGGFAISLVLKGIYAAVSAPEYLFLAALTAMLFRPPDLQTIPFDRICFVLLLGVASLRFLLYREQVRIYAASWPMLALLLIGIWSVLSQPFDVSAWSVLAAKWIVPVVMFHIAGLVFSTEESRRKLEWFSIAVLAYLSLTAVFFLTGFWSLIFPRFILNESIGIHADRARGPFLQAVANGVCLSILGIFALHLWERRRLRGVLAAVLLVATPVALLATKTRSVWLGAAMSLVLLVLFARKRRSRTIAAVIACLTAAFLCVALLLNAGDGTI